MKKLFFAFMATAMLFSSCKKEEIKPSSANPVAALEQQTNWTVDALTLADTEMKNIISSQVGSNAPCAVYMEVHLNEPATPVQQVATSAMRPSRNTGREQILRINRISNKEVAISFITKGGDPYVGSFNENNGGPQPPQQLQVLQVLDWSGGENYSYCTFSPAKHLNGIYTVEETTDGVRLTMENEPGKKVTINLNRELKE